MGKTFTETINENYLIEIARGVVDNHRIYTRWGRSENLVKNVLQTLGGIAGIKEFPTLEEFVDVASDSAKDTDGGDGLRKVLIIGIDQNFNPINEIITLDGVTPVKTLNKYRFISNVFGGAPGTEVGDDEVNDGEVLGIGDTSLSTFFQVQSQDGTSNLLFDVVPADRDLYITQIQYTAHNYDGGGGNNPVVKFRAFLQLDGLGRELVREDTVNTGANNLFTLDLRAPYKIPAKARYWITIISDTNGANVEGTVFGFTVKK